jgi:cell division septation protein DedD
VVQKTLIDGQIYFDRQRDIDARPALEKEKQDLLAKEKKAAEEKKAEGKSESKPEKKPDAKKKQPPTSQSNVGNVAGGGL